jgi:Carboxymuconolactone decarboxylase family
MTHHLVPLEAPFSEEIADVLKGYPQQDGYILTLFRTFANSLRFLKKGVPNLLDKGSPLPLRIREIVILRTTANRNCEYEWGVHVTVFAGAAKLVPAQVAATRDAAVDPTLWGAGEANLIMALDQLCTQGRIDDATLVEFEQNWTVEQQLEIFALCGTYHTISFVANNARLPNEVFGARFPAAL